MRHSDIIAHLCHRLSTGDGINSALAEIGLTTDYLADHLTGPDRARLQQAHAIHRETLEKQLAERARAGRPTRFIASALHALRKAGPLVLPGDDDDVEAERYINRHVPKRIVSKIAALPATEARATDEFQILQALSRLPEAPERASEIEAEQPRQQDTLPAPKPPKPPRPPSPEPAPSPPPAPEPPKAHWFRMFTGRAVLRTEDGTVVKSVLPGEAGYPHVIQFTNWS